MSGRLPKKLAERAHARRRAEERYGLIVGPHARDVIAATIHAGDARLIEKQSHRLRVYELALDDGHQVRIVWDRRRQEVVTFLPREAARG